MKIKINIGSSSFLIPGNEAWNNLNNEKKLFFSNYGDLRGTIIKCKNDEYLVLVIFILDLIKNLNKNKDKKLIVKSIDLLFKTLEKHLQKSSYPSIVAISSWTPESIIRISNSNIDTEIIFKYINSRLDRLIKLYANLHIINLDNQFGFSGYKNAFETRNWYLANCHLSSEGLEILSNSIKIIINRNEKPSKKVLVLDCDNTLWGGVIGEDKMSGILLGQDGLGKAFLDFQNSIKRINDEGILLAISSKNNEKDVWEVFLKHQSMVLKKKDIVSSKINWQDKALSIKQISLELGLDLNSFVFWDDNPLERDKIKRALPQVMVIDPPQSVTEWPNLLNKLDCFAKFSFTKEDKKKTKQYKIRAKFSRDIQVKNDEKSFLKSIKLKAKIININLSTIKRASQLSMKTNQFNLSNIRYSESSINQYKKNKNINSSLVKLNDIYGDHGIVGFFSTKKINLEIIFIENFLMSCRVLGRHLESWMFNKIMTDAKKNNYKYILAKYIPTEKNKIIKQSLIENGFIKIDKINNKKLYKNKFKKYLSYNNYYVMTVSKSKIPFVEVYG